jgi:asparagine synthase (glutamine-hydrolysing)
LRGPLRDWAEDLLDPQSIGRDGLLDAAQISETWAAHQAGTQNLQHAL